MICIFWTCSTSLFSCWQIKINNITRKWDNRTTYNAYTCALSIIKTISMK